MREKLRTTAVRTGRTTPPRISKQRCPSVVELSAPHPIVQPIEGEDYTVLAPPPPEKRTRWRVDVTRDRRRLAGHRRDVGREVAVKRVDVVAESGA
ncbi:hypothetical protein AB0F64_37865 [Streptomyces sp. NPDC026294]|uniref:hypothetical protein n=1 Tax=Streptomyces sp. NPDC026294 TaxID=3155362 RepID=UPI0033E9DA28